MHKVLFGVHVGRRNQIKMKQMILGITVLHGRCVYLVIMSKREREREERHRGTIDNSKCLRDESRPVLTFNFTKLKSHHPYDSPLLYRYQVLSPSYVSSRVCMTRASDSSWMASISISFSSSLQSSSSAGTGVPPLTTIRWPTNIVRPILSM